MGQQSYQLSGAMEEAETQRNTVTSKQESPSLQLKVLVPVCLFKVKVRSCC